MCTLEAHFQCYDRFFEIFSNEIEQNELILENMFSQLLIKFFKHVTVEVNVRFPPHEDVEMQYCIIHVKALCDHQIYASSTDTYDELDVHIEQSMCSVLRELFCSVFVDDITTSFSPQGNTIAKSSAGTK